MNDFQNEPRRFTTDSLLSSTSTIPGLICLSYEGKNVLAIYA